MRNLALIFADAHLRNRRGDEEWALDQIAAAAVHHRVEIVIGAGDMIDRQQNRAAPITHFMRFLDDLEAVNKLPFYYVQGQHEWDDPPWLSGHRNAHHLDSRVLPLGAFKLYGLDFRAAGALQDAFQLIPPEADFLICHQVWAEWMGEICSPQGSFAEVPGQITRLVTGDLHKFVLEQHHNADGRPMLCCSPGATCQQKIDEPNQHYYVLLREDGSLVKQPLKSRVMIDWPILQMTEDLERFVVEIEPRLAVAAQTWAAAEMPSDLAKPYLRITYNHDLKDAERRVSRAVNDRAILTFKEQPPDVLPTSFESRLPAGAAATPLAVLPEVLDPDDDPQAHELAARLLNAGDVAGEYARWHAEFMGVATVDQEEVAVAED